MPDKHRGGRPEFEVAYYTKELGKSLQRKMLTQQLAQLSDGAAAAFGSHGEELVQQPDARLPQEDRAG
jgi:hypothetical protein